MKTLGPGKARTALAAGITDLLGPQYQTDALGNPMLFRLESEKIAAILGGAIEEALFEATGTRDKQQRGVFWRALDHHLLDLTRTLRASNLLDKIR